MAYFVFVVRAAHVAQQLLQARIAPLPSDLAAKFKERHHGQLLVWYGRDGFDGPLVIFGTDHVPLNGWHNSLHAIAHSLSVPLGWVGEGLEPPHPESSRAAMSSPSGEPRVCANARLSPRRS